MLFLMSKDVFTYREYCIVGSIGVYISNNDHYYYHFVNFKRIALFFCIRIHMTLGPNRSVILHDVDQACATVLKRDTLIVVLVGDQDDNDDSGRCRTSLRIL